MNRINELFENKKEGILSIFTTAGYPRLDCTVEVLESLQNSGVDMIELGMPFSDPLADGPVIQNSSSIAIENGMTLKVLFSQLEGFRDKINVPVILMGYVNTVMQYGFEAFCAKCDQVGIDGLILPDLPLFEYETLYKDMFEKQGLLNVFLITPQTSDERIHKLDQASEGFLYLVSSASTTGSTKVVTGVEDYLKRIQDMNLKSDTVVGFNIKDHQTFSAACKYSNGAIIGSAFVKAIAKSEDLNGDISNFVEMIKQ
jgi:tryptophan synthase alpha chain